MHARGSGEAARRAKRGRVSRFARRTTVKKETARSLLLHGEHDNSNGYCNNNTDYATVD